MDPIDLRASLAETLSGADAVDARTLSTACLWICGELERLDFSVAEAEQLARGLLRAAGRVLIDTAQQSADPGAWQGAEEMVLIWVDQALRTLGYQVVPTEDAGRSPLSSPPADWH